MKYGEVAGVGKPVSRVAMGTMIITSKEQERSSALLDAALDVGISTFDTAHVYAGGWSERGLGAWIAARGVREDVVVFDKGCHPGPEGKRVTPEALAADLADALERLGFGYIDIYGLHRDDPDVPVGEIVDAFNEHLAAGRIRAFAGSNWTHERLAAANDYAGARGLVGFAASSPNFGLAEQVEDPWGPGCTSLSGPANRAAREWHARTGTAVFAYSSLGRGLFSGRVTRGNLRETADGACRKAYCHEVNFRRLDRARELAAEKGLTVAQVALAWVLSQALEVYALTGGASPEEIAQNAAAADVELTPAELDWLDLRRDDR